MDPIKHLLTIPFVRQIILENIKKDNESLSRDEVSKIADGLITIQSSYCDELLNRSFDLERLRNRRDGGCQRCQHEMEHDWLSPIDPIVPGNLP